MAECVSQLKVVKLSWFPKVIFRRRVRSDQACQQRSAAVQSEFKLFSLERNPSQQEFTTKPEGLQAVLLLSAHKHSGLWVKAS